MYDKIEVHEKFDLWTLGGKKENQTQEVVISSHGRQTLMNSDFRVPQGVRIQFYCPHGYTLQDPTLVNVLTAKVMPVEQVPGGSKSYDYVLSRFQGAANGSNLEDEANIPAMGATKDELIGKGFKLEQLQNYPERPLRDLVTIKSAKFWKEPSLSEVIEGLRSAGYKYDTIHCSFCRSPGLRAEKGSFDAVAGKAAK